MISSTHTWITVDWFIETLTVQLNNRIIYFHGDSFNLFFSRFPLRLGPCRVTWKYHMFIIDGCDLILDGIRNNIYFCTRSYQLKKQIL